ncbi:hypothetical protein T484DRAFT_1823794 [Baffinella frigidus]|nr:hypothetical protein T484DRAFT_1823794 [Cryptophyta sp. CCMP2293]
MAPAPTFQAGASSSAAGHRPAARSFGAQGFDAGASGEENANGVSFGLGSSARSGPPDPPQGLAPQLYSSPHRRHDGSAHAPRSSTDNVYGASGLPKPWQDSRSKPAQPSFMAPQAAERRAMQGIQQRPGTHGAPSQRQAHGGAGGGGAPNEMEQQLEMMAMSLRGNQEEAEGVRKGLMMLQPFGGGEEARSAPQVSQGQQRPAAARPSLAQIRAQVEHTDAHSPAPRSRPIPESRERVRGGDGGGEVGECPSDYLAQWADPG